MEPEILLDGKVTLYCGDVMEGLAALAPDSVDSILTDAPYHLQSIHKRFAKVGRDDKTWTSSGPHQRTAAGFMNKQWDGGDIAFRPETWAAAWRVLKPGGHLAAFGGTRTFHRMMVAIEDAGFDLRDTLMWVYGQGFPKSHDVTKQIDKAAGIWRGRAGEVVAASVGQPSKGTEYERAEKGEAATPEPREWEGWGTALKPAWEPIALFRKPLASKLTVAANVLAHGTGAINIGACRVESSKDDQAAMKRVVGFNVSYSHGEVGIALEGSADGSLHKRDRSEFDVTQGRWPANVIHDGSAEVVELFPNAGGGAKGGSIEYSQPNMRGDNYNRAEGRQSRLGMSYGDEGSAARFFYCAKATKAERLGSKHPTVKPIALLQWLVRLITPPRGVCLDMFAGTGTTAEAAVRESMRAILIERETEYQADIRNRVALIYAGPEERTRAQLKLSGKLASPDDLPLFADTIPSDVAVPEAA